MGKIYIKLNSVMNVSFSYIPMNSNDYLYLRAMIVFSSPDEMHLPVNRCPNHRIPLPQNHIANENGNYFN